MAVVQAIQSAVSKEIASLFQVTLEPSAIQINETKPEFEGDYTVVLFALVKSLRKSPEALGKELGEQLVAAQPGLFTKFNVIKGFLNLTLSENYWLEFLHGNYNNPQYGRHPHRGEKVMVEYSSPNTNKPLHLGHLRNNFLGWSIAEIYKANGYDVVKTCIVNDRGVHICKSMLAWQKFGNGATPQTTGTKGDHLVGDYYVKFENELKAQTAPILEKVMAGTIEGFSTEDADKLQLFLGKLPQLEGNKEKTAEIHEEIRDIVRNNTPIMKEVREMLLKWEQGDAATMALWKEMNSWVYAGFDETYKRIGSDFDKIYYESDTYLLGKDLVEEGLKKDVFFQKEDGSVWIDLTADGLDQKIVRRRDGTSVYITQDIGLAVFKYNEYKCDESIYVVGDEQNYHFKVLKLIAQKLGLPAADGIFHLSYGMVELPTGKMKSREGTVVDADDLVDGMVDIARQKTEELGKVKDFNESELAGLYDTIGLGALKFFLLRVDPKKRMVFNPEESIDFHGFTGPFIQFTYARTSAILRKEQPKNTPSTSALLPLEKNVIIELEKYPAVLEQARIEMNPSAIAVYTYKLAQTFSTFVTALRVLTAETEEKKELRLQLCQMAVNVIGSSMHILGIRVPERM
ncbi:arginine--tRNA ligase [Paraflavitalea sp. CAU 1676]|uniref:arginine--tRNA ligase n=1 Tax=Paraflavitalea sp. CAU 1676 TaxID=3032598 RepID=UPI0023DB67F6|nr:arginine--tRNA ligase [Paraflavitalea sp. CAU 1676]MDF2187784.1 arginine--tRNA ligase [Paraflavitalea sp. CAU 1676]